MPTCRIVVGRLLEIDLETGFRSTQEVDEFSEVWSAYVTGRVGPGRNLVAVSDLRRIRVSAPVVAERLKDLLKLNPQSVERSAILCDAPTAAMQAARLMQEAENSRRRLFGDPAMLSQWLDEVLSHDERARLQVFLDASRR